ncbi:MAG: hypothetical protein ACW99V_09960 [Candidatus Thorarchaeota archaeon]
MKDHISVEVLVNGDRLELSSVERLHRDIDSDDSETRRGLVSKEEW